jgi:hypothetical protein
MGQRKLRAVALELVVNLQALGFLQRRRGLRVLPEGAAGIAVVRERARHRSGIGTLPPGGLAGILQHAKRLFGGYPLRSRK